MAEDDIPSIGGFQAPATRPERKGTQQPAAQETDAVPSFGGVRTQAQAEQAKAPWYEDIYRTAIAKGTRGAAAIPGMFGDIASLTGTPNKYLPTTQDIMGRIESISPEVKQALQYEPQNIYSRYLGAAAEFAPAALIPGLGVGGLGARLAGAAGSGFASEAAKDALRGQEGLGAAAGTLGAAVAGGMTGTALAQKGAQLTRDVFMPGRSAAMRLAEAQKGDLVTGGRRGAAASMDEAVSQGVAPATVGGIGTEKLIKEAAGRAGPEARGAFNVAVEQAREQAPSIVTRSIENMFGRAPKAFDEADAIAERVKQLNDANYKRVMSMPAAKAIPQTTLAPIVNRLPKNTINNVLDDMRQQGVNPATMGLVKTPSGYAIPPRGASLRFWDEVKQDLDSQISSLYDPVTKALKPGMNKQAATLTGLKSDLVSTLDKAIPDYQKIRFEAAELYGARNAIEAGYRFFNDNNFRNLHNIKKVADKKLTPDQREDFAFGAAAAYNDLLSKNPSAALSMFGGRNAKFMSDKLSYALGPDRADELIGTINAQNLNMKMKDLSNIAQSSGFSIGDVAAGAGAGALSQLALTGESFLQNLAAFNLAPGALFGLMASMGVKASYNAKERRIGEEILRLASDPAASAQIGRLIREVPEARSFLAKTLSGIARAAPPSAAAAEGQAAGGRIERASGGRVNMADQIMAQIDKARKELQSETGALLNHDDETVVKALKVANERI